MSLNFYYFNKIIGSGAFATVYECLNIPQKTIVAMKVTTRTLKTYELKLVKKEIQILKSLSHPNIIKIQEYFNRSSTWYLVLEYCIGGNLYDYMKNQIQLEQKQVLTIAYYLVNALKYLEDKKIAHRDLKLANILIDDKGIVKIADLGFAKSVENGQTLKSKAGTTSTMAPEILNNTQNQSYTTKCDIWSFGIIIYQLLYSRNPFFSSKINAANVNFQKLLFPTSIKTSPEVKDLIKRCLTINPQKRISAQQLMNHPWIMSFKNQISPIYLKTKVNDLHNILTKHKSYTKTKFKQDILDQYTISLIHSVRFFKAQYNNYIDNMKHYIQRILYFTKKLIQKKSNYKDLINPIRNIFHQKIAQIQKFTVIMNLPSQSFQLTKYCQDCKNRNKQVITLIYKNISEFLMQIDDSDEFQFLDKGYQRALIQNLMKKGDKIKTQQEYFNYWGVIRYICKLMKIQLSMFSIELDYHETVEDPTIKLIEQESVLKSKEELDRLLVNQQEVQIQKMDLLNVQIFSNPKNDKTKVSKLLIDFMIQTADMQTMYFGEQKK